jgi:putative ABC transport system permease protein
MEPEMLGRAVAEAVHAVDRGQAITDIRTLEAIKAQSTAPNRLRTMLLAIFAVLALALSAVGIYGVISYTVAQRTHEIGVRAALGAPTAALLRMVLINGMTLAGLGLVLGTVGALGLTRLLETILFGIGARDPLTMTAAAGVLALVAALACYIPARRAARLDPLVALREM